MVLSIIKNLLLVIFVGDALLLIVVVLMQRPKNEGLGAAFGGGMTENLFGAQTTNVLQKFTRWLGGVFFGLALVISVINSRQAGSTKSDIQKQLLNTPKPIAIEQTALPLKQETAVPLSPAPSAVPLASVPPAPGTPSPSPTFTPKTTTKTAPAASAKP